jgi:hypothetical protein
MMMMMMMIMTQVKMKYFPNGIGVGNKLLIWQVGL